MVSPVPLVTDYSVNVLWHRLIANIPTCWGLDIDSLADHTWWLRRKELEGHRPQHVVQLGKQGNRETRWEILCSDYMAMVTIEGLKNQHIRTWHGLGSSSVVRFVSVVQYVFGKVKFSLFVNIMVNSKGGHPQCQSAPPQYCGQPKRLRNCGLKKLRNCDCGPSIFDFRNSATLCSLRPVQLLYYPFSSAQDVFKNLSKNCRIL